MGLIEGEAAMVENMGSGHPAGVRVIRLADRSSSTAQSMGMRREAALAPDTTGATNLWMGLATTPPGNASAWHHHGDRETGIYVVRGRARFSWGAHGVESAEVGPGDFLSVPPYVVHREEALGPEEVVMVIARGRGDVLSVDLPGPTATGLVPDHDQ